MKVLYISDRQKGGIAQHVQTLVACLPVEAVHYVIGVGGDAPFEGKNGHDLREGWQFARIVHAFKPDVIHFHILPFMMVLCLRWLRATGQFRGSIVVSEHAVFLEPMSIRCRILHWLVGDCYMLPVSQDVWDSVRRTFPNARGEVFFNPVIIPKLSSHHILNPSTSHPLTIGMVGRNVPVKDWPAFHRVVERVKADFEGKGGLRTVRILNAGEMGFCDGRAAIAQMDVMLMTSRCEAMPTVLLEAFAKRTPVCGFIPKGGLAEILALSNGALREVFIEERDEMKLAKIVCRVLEDPELRRRIVEDGRRIVTQYFDAEKNVRGRLMDVYRLGVAR